MKRKFELLKSTDLVVNNFLALRQVHVKLDKFDGGTKEVNYTILKKGDAVCVTLYDKVTDCFMLIRQFCTPAAMNENEHDPWLLQTVAGHIDKGETPEQAAIRETKEESDLDCDEVVFMAQGFTSPGISTEIHYHFLAKFDSTKVDVTKSYGLEDEDIQLVVIPRSEALGMIQRQEIRNSNAIIGITMALLHLK